MKIMVANKDEYMDYFSKRTDALNLKVLNEQEDYIIHSIEIDAQEKDLSLMYVSINNLLNKQYEKNNYIDLDKIKEIDALFKTLNKEECKIINAYAEVNNYRINSLEEVKELISNINDYQILEKYSLEEVGELLTEKTMEYSVRNEMKDYINYSKLAKKYLSDFNIKEDFCSYGLLVNTRNMLNNDLIEEKIKADKVLQIEIANKKLYEESSYNNRIYLSLPIERERLKEKLKLINIDLEKLTKDDIQITLCRLVNFNNKELTDAFDFVIEGLIDKITHEYDTTISLEEVESLYNEIKNYNNTDMRKFVAIIDAKEDIIINFRQIVEYAKNTKQYEVIPDIKNYFDMGKYLVYETGHFDDVSHLEDYINYERLARDYTQKGYTYNGDFTRTGFLIEKEEFVIDKQKEEFVIDKQKEEEELFE